MSAKMQALGELLQSADAPAKASTKMLRLYEHVDAYAVVLDWIEEHEQEITDAGGVLPPELEQLLDETEGDLKEKIGRTGLVVRNLVANAKAAKEEADRLSAMAKGYTRQADALKAYLLYQLRRMGETRVDTALCKVRRQMNPPVVRPADPANIPEKYRIIPPPPPPVFDRDSALADLKAAHCIPEEATDEPIVIDGIAIERGEHVRIY